MYLTNLYVVEIIMTKSNVLPILTVFAATIFLHQPSAAVALQTSINSIAGDVEQQSSVSDETIGSIELIGGDESESSAPVLVPGNLYTMTAVRLSAKEPGVIESILQLGDQVNEGQTIAQLDYDVLRARLTAAEKELEIARIESANDVDLQFARVSSKVNQAVLERSMAANRQYRKALSKTEIERLRLELQRSQLSAEQAERTNKTNLLTEQLRCEQVRIASLQLNGRTIAAPISGVVTEVTIEKGEWVNAGQPIARIVNTDKLRFTGFVDSREILPSTIAESASLIVDFKGDMGRDEANESSDDIDVKITFVNPEIDPASGLFEVRAEVDNSDKKMYAGLKSVLKLRRKN